MILLTNIESIISHHVLVVVEAMMKIILLFLVTKEPLQQIVSDKSTYGGTIGCLAFVHAIL